MERDRVVTINYAHLKVIFSEADYKLVRDVFGWTVSGTVLPQVVATKKPFAGQLICRLLLEAPTELLVDHISGNRLDNSRENLRLVTPSQSVSNTAASKTRKHSLPKGVSRYKHYYRAQIGVNYRQIFLGTFLTVEDAEAAYKLAAEKYFGIYAVHISRHE